MSNRAILLFSSAPRLERGELNPQTSRPSKRFIWGNQSGVFVDGPASKEGAMISLPRNRGICVAMSGINWAVEEELSASKREYHPPLVDCNQEGEKGQQGLQERGRVHPVETAKRGGLRTQVEGGK
jgi:hypothetical protein